ncbi:hypothetical protein [Pontibacter sp. G13]|uniref:hypothetical protein n=1 Tax=Pontibacter sp. G13 TaxID=3074898 RepID=UPI0028896210|nr:hypothetical protein [Pontibacter sp. G13]WNJ20135.1 hypothetical protein RJD25_06595 [Pontibacter sp. G13]
MFLLRQVFPFLACVCLLSQASGQTPDYRLDSFFPTFTTRSSTPSHRGVEANMMCFSDSSFIHLVIEVIDPDALSDTTWHPENHLEVWMGLDDNAYPNDFEYRLHPDFVSPIPSPNAPMRLFSIHGTRVTSLRRSDIIRATDYPSDEAILGDSLNVPLAPELRVMPFPIGLVGFGLYPDNRPARLLNYSDMRRVQQVLGKSFGPLEKRIAYYSEWTDRGYIINMQIPPEALGIAPLPTLSSIRVAVDVHKFNEPESASYPILTSSPQRIAQRPASFTRIDLGAPISTNFTPIPDEWISAHPLAPLGIYTSKGWEMIHLDVDALVYGPSNSSAKLVETGIFPIKSEWKQSIVSGVPVRQWTISSDYVNELAREFLWAEIDDQLIKTSRARDIISEPIRPSLELFFFPDGTPGALVMGNSSLDPYGWGSCGTCLAEQISIYRLEGGQKRLLLNIEQGNGPNAYCMVGKYRYADKAVSQMDWIRPGKLMVLRLKHRYREEIHRIKLSWEDDGSDVKIEWID